MGGGGGGGDKETIGGTGGGGDKETIGGTGGGTGETGTIGVLMYMDTCSTSTVQHV